MEIWDFWSFSSYSCNKAVKRSNELRTRFVMLVHWTHGDMRFFKVLTHTVVISRKTVKWVEITICDTTATNSRSNESFEAITHTVVMSPKTVKWAENTICDTCALNSRRYEFFQVLSHTVVISFKTVKWAETRFVIIVHWYHGDLRFLKF